MLFSPKYSPEITDLSIPSLIPAAMSFIGDSFVRSGGSEGNMHEGTRLLG